MIIGVGLFSSPTLQFLVQIRGNTVNLISNFHLLTIIIGLSSTKLTWLNLLIFVNLVTRVILILILHDKFMKVVGAKLDDSDYDRFESFCLDEGLSLRVKSYEV